MTKTAPLADRASYILEGHSIIGDPRTTPIRGDLADIKLAGKLFAPHYAIPMIRSCIVPVTTMFAAADDRSTPNSELLMGEKFAVLDISGQWAWGYGLHDDYLGYVALSALGDKFEPDHWVSERAAPLFSTPHVRTPIIAYLPMGARIAAGEYSECGRFRACNGGFVHVRHISPIGDVPGNIADIAEKFSGTAYGWGARSGRAIDCSGLVQLALAMKGISAPRDSDMQNAALGTDVAEGDLRRGDLVFFPGHVGIMADATNIIHANTHWMMTVTEPLKDVSARFADEAGGPVLAMRRVG